MDFLQLSSDVPMGCSSILRGDGIWASWSGRRVLCRVMKRGEVGSEKWFTVKVSEMLWIHQEALGVQPMGAILHLPRLTVSSPHSDRVGRV